MIYVAYPPPSPKALKELIDLEKVWNLNVIGIKSYSCIPYIFATYGCKRLIFQIFDPSKFIV